MGVATAKAYVILDGTLVAIDRIGGLLNKLYYSGKHKRHGVNLQILADAAGRLVWISPGLPGSVHDLTAARTHNLIHSLTRAAVATFADKGYQGAGGAIGTPTKGRDLPEGIQAVNSAHTKIRAVGERANATLKTWRLLRKVRCCPRRVTALAAAILTLETHAR